MLPTVLGAEVRAFVVYLEREFVPPAVRAFVDAVIAWAPGNLVPVGGATRGPA
ncbi:MAG: hypothetical protein R3B72_19275 [Polyangiaceae bacterium]